MASDTKIEIPYMQCKAARIYPLSEGEHRGSIQTSKGDFDVRITREVKDSLDVVDRVWARVLLGKINRGNVDEFAMAAASKSMADPSWLPVKTDLRDGEVGYMATFTYDFPDDAEMDRFLEEAKTFIEHNIDEIKGYA